MPAFTYRAYDAAGRLCSGWIEARGREWAVADLRTEGLRVFAIAPAAAGIPFWKRDLFGRARVTDAARIGFLKEFGMLLGAGLTVDRCLRLVQRHASAAMRPVLADLLERVVAGASLSKAMAAHGEAFPRDLVDAVRAGEATGTLVDVIASLTASLERRDAVRRHLTSAMIYPVLLLLMALGTLALVIGTLVPALAPMFEGAGRPAPFAIRAAGTLGDALAAWWPHLAGGLALAAFLTTRSWNDPRFAALRSRWVLRLPLVREALAQAARRLTEGASFAASLAALRPYAPSTLNLIASGEQVNRLGTVLIHAAAMHEAQTRERIDRLLTPLVTVVLGGLIGSLIMSVMGAVLSVGEMAQ